MNDKTDVLILKQTDYKENDVILHVLSKEYGKLSFIAKGLKKTTSKNAYACQLFSYSTFVFDFKEQSTLQLLKTASVIESYRALRENLFKLSAVSVCAEIITQLVDVTVEHFDVYKSTLDRMVGETDVSFYALNLFLSTILNLEGSAPFVDGCVECGRESGIISIGVGEGGFVCKDCNMQKRLPMYNFEDLQGFRYIAKCQFSQYDILKEQTVTNSFYLTRTQVSFLNVHCGISCRSFRFLENYIQTI